MSSEEVKTPEEDSTTKKAKLMNQYPIAPDSDWPEAWLLPDKVEDQCLENRLEPNVPVSVEDLKKLGIHILLMTHWG